MAYVQTVKTLALKIPMVKELNRLRHKYIVKHKLVTDNDEEQVTPLLHNQNKGYCHCCRTETVFQINSDWLRDNYICLTCFSIPRQRHIQYVLDSFFKGWENKSIHESSPSNDLISRYCRDYSTSQFFEGIPAGTVHNGVRCENLEKLTFEDNSFDILITQDVFEHIFNPDQAAKEIMRVLKPGGVHVFTAPKFEGLAKSFQRARLTDAGIDYLHEPEYHGNPVGDGRALVTYHYGDDFENLIYEWAKVNTTTYVTRCRDIGIDGKFIEVFVTRKPIN